MSIVLQTNGLTKMYDEQRGIRDISITVNKGEVYGFLGQNGAGKSTFVRTVLGMIQPTGGAGELLGAPIGSVASRRSVGYLPELFRYPAWLTGRQLLKAHADLVGVEKVKQQSHINELVELVGLKGRDHEKIKGYSKGMQQRIGMACALLNDPDIVFLDEPTSALDPIGRKEVRDIIRHLKQQGKTVFLNSHLLNEVESVCDRIAIIHRGEFVVEGDWRTLSAIRPAVEIELGRDIMPSFPPFVSAAKPVSSAKHAVWQLELESLDDVPHLLFALAEQKVAVYRVSPVEAHLEDVFLYWVGKKEGERRVDYR